MQIASKKVKSDKQVIRKDKNLTQHGDKFPAASISSVAQTTSVYRQKNENTTEGVSTPSLEQASSFTFSFICPLKQSILTK